MPTPERLRETTKKIAEDLDRKIVKYFDSGNFDSTESLSKRSEIDNAIRRLSVIGGPEAIKTLGNLTTRPKMMDIAINALGNTGNPAAIPFLKKALESTSSTESLMVEHSVIWALWALNRVECIPLLASHAEKTKNGITKGLSINAVVDIAKGNPTHVPKTPSAKAAYMIAPHVYLNESAKVMIDAFEAARAGKISPRNVRLYLKQLRAASGNLK